MKLVRAVVDRYKRFFPLLVMFSMGALSIGWSIYGMITDQAQAISRKFRWVARSEDEVYFWISIAFHFGIGMYLIYIGIRVARDFKKTRKSL